MVCHAFAVAGLISFLLLTGFVVRRMHLADGVTSATKHLGSSFIKNLTDPKINNSAMTSRPGLHSPSQPSFASAHRDTEFGVVGESFCGLEWRS